MARQPSGESVARTMIRRRGRLLRPFGYIDASGVHRRWREGADVAGQELRELELRGAPIVEVEPAPGEG